MLKYKFFFIYISLKNCQSIFVLNLHNLNLHISKFKKSFTKVSSFRLTSLTVDFCRRALSLLPLTN